MPPLLLRLILALSAVVTGTMAAEAEWFVSRISGVALARAPGSTASVVLARGSIVADSATVETGRAGRLKMTRGASAIVLGPRSSLSLRTDAFGGSTVLQSAGAIEYEVEKRKVRYFSVETPFLAAVVKGTRFLVRLGSGKVDLSVSRGIVGVTALGSGETADLAPGQRASTAGARLRVAGGGRKPLITRGLPRAAMVRALAPDAVADGVAAAHAGSGSTAAGGPARASTGGVSTEASIAGSGSVTAGASVTGDGIRSDVGLGGAGGVDVGVGISNGGVGLDVGIGDGALGVGLGGGITVGLGGGLGGLGGLK
jgi:FecR protein